ncbi:MAG: thioredoxin [Armatimonadetes bacterium]|jgi:thioredoxin 1|nr:thioredoxin [Armatimonadota bacterium]
MSQAMAINQDNFEAEVINSEIPVLVDFWAGWCMPCKMLAPVVDELASDFAGKVKVVKVDIDENPGLASAYNVRGIPTLLAFNKGQEVDRIVGAQPKAAIAEKLNGLLGA